MSIDCHYGAFCKRRGIQNNVITIIKNLYEDGQNVWRWTKLSQLDESTWRTVHSNDWSEIRMYSITYTAQSCQMKVEQITNLTEKHENNDWPNATGCIHNTHRVRPTYNLSIRSLMPWIFHHQYCVNSQYTAATFNWPSLKLNILLAIQILLITWVYPIILAPKLFISRCTCHSHNIKSSTAFSTEVNTMVVSQ